MATLSIEVEDSREMIFMRDKLQEIHDETLYEIKTWLKRADKLKKVIDEIDSYIEIEDNATWRFVKDAVPTKTEETPQLPKEKKVQPTRGKKGKKPDYKVLPCPRCGSTNTIGDGYSKLKNGLIPKRTCKDCGSGYTNKEFQSVVRSRFSDEIKNEAVDLVYVNKMSVREAADFISEKYKTKVSSTAIYNWIHKYKSQTQFNPAPTNQEPEKRLELEMFKENEGFDYRAKTPKTIGDSEVYHSGNGKIVIRRSGKGCSGELVLTSEKDIEKLLSYDEKDFTWVIKNLNGQKQNILRGYLRDVKNAKQTQ